MGDGLKNTWHLLASLHTPEVRDAHTHTRTDARFSLAELGFTPGIITDTTHSSFEGLSRLLIKDVPGFLSDVGLHRA